MGVADFTLRLQQVVLKKARGELFFVVLWHLVKIKRYQKVSDLLALKYCKWLTRDIFAVCHTYELSPLITQITLRSLQIRF